jgi:hypothetical protein
MIMSHAGAQAVKPDGIRLIGVDHLLDLGHPFNTKGFSTAAVEIAAIKVRLLGIEDGPGLTHFRRDILVAHESS